MEGEQIPESEGKRKVVHRHVRIWWLIGWLITIIVVLIYYWSDLQKAFSA
jgi:predicted nucleic acid-binding Zn ribbon protein